MRQSDRRAATRARLLDGAIDALVEVGLGGFRTADVVKRAGSSQGALFDHFPTKAALLGATIEHLFAVLTVEYEADFARLPDEERTIAGGLRLLWRVFCDERLHAAYEAFTAARTDPELRVALEPVVTAHGDRLQSLAIELLGDQLPDDPQAVDRFRTAVELAVVAMEGLVLEQLARDVPGAADRLLGFLEELASLALLAPPLTPDPTGGTDR